MQAKTWRWIIVQLITCCALAATFPPALQAEPIHLKYTFAPGEAEAGYEAVAPTAVYSKEAGFGFESPKGMKAIDQVGPGKLHDGFVTSDKPFYFSIALPEGNYNVTVALGDPRGASDTTVKAELRRLLLEGFRSEAPKMATFTFTVNVRTPRIDAKTAVRLKDREKTTEIWDWDEKLTLEFSGKRPCLSAIEVESATVPTLFILGDSTVCDQPREPWNSWGQMLPRFLKGGIAVANHAESGESLRSSIGAHRLEKVASQMKAGDYLFIQYGHNDMKERGPDVGAFTTYKADLRKFAQTARDKGATPVLVTSMNRKSFDASGHVANTLGDYPQAVRDLAREEKIALIDLHAMSKTLYEAIGPANIGNAFVDGTHHNGYGSYELARCVVEGVRGAVPSLVPFLKDDLPPFDPAKPDRFEDFGIPPSPMSTATVPDGK